jgi:hypothetical protein
MSDLKCQIMAFRNQSKVFGRLWGVTVEMRKQMILLAEGRELTI